MQRIGAVDHGPHRGKSFMTVLFLVLIFAGGLILGSFLNVVIYRVPIMAGLVEGNPATRFDFALPASHCPACKRPLKAWHLVPLVSWRVLRGRCAACGAAISARYPLIEAAGGVCALAAIAMFGPGATALVAFAAACLLICLGVIDFETGYLPDVLTLPLIVLGLGANAAGLFVPLLHAAIGAAVGYGIFWMIRFAYLKARGLEGLGLGDAKMLAGIGALVGWAALPVGVLIAAGGGLLLMGALAITGRPVSRETPVRFGPFLAIGGLAALGLNGAGLLALTLHAGA